MTRPFAAGGVLALMLGALLMLASPATASPATATGAEGQTLTVSQADGLSSDGTTVTVTGSGYNTLKGIYVALCVTPAVGEVPTPCGGGAATAGSGGLSGWISSNPPSYGKDLVTPFGADGTFSVPMTLAPMIGAVDCRTTSCAVVTRADHTRADDRTADVVVRVSFGEAGAASSPAPTATATPAPEAAPVLPGATTAAVSPGSNAPSIPGSDTTTETATGLSAAGPDVDSGSSVAPVAIGSGILAVLAIGAVGYIAQRRKPRGGGPTNGGGG